MNENHPPVGPPQPQPPSQPTTLPASSPPAGSHETTAPVTPMDADEQQFRATVLAELAAEHQARISAQAAPAPVQGEAGSTIPMVPVGPDKISWYAERATQKKLFRSRYAAELEAAGLPPYVPLAAAALGMTTSTLKYRLRTRKSLLAPLRRYTSKNPAVRSRPLAMQVNTEHLAAAKMVRVVWTDPQIRARNRQKQWEQKIPEMKMDSRQFEV